MPKCILRLINIIGGILNSIQPLKLIKLIFPVLFIFSVLFPDFAISNDGEKSKNNVWYNFNNSHTAIIFVHGIFSNSEDCWLSNKGKYWPKILNSDSRFGNPSIYLGGYYTDFSSGLYRISDAANELFSYLKVKSSNNLPPALEKPNLIFIAHSTGGLVIRYLLERNQEIFLNKNVGLVLLASPSRGSAWSNRLEWLHKYFGNKMAGQLARDNDFIVDLDARFADLISSKKLPNLVGIDIFENKFILPGTFFSSTYVVSPQDSASYFGAYRIVPDSDHFSIAKPNSVSDASHQFLYEFYETTFKPLVENKKESLFSNSFLNFLESNPENEEIKKFLLKSPHISKLAISRGSYGRAYLLQDLLISNYRYDLVILDLNGRYSNDPSTAEFVKFMSPNDNLNDDNVLSQLRSIESHIPYYISPMFSNAPDLLKEALEKREDYRGPDPYRYWAKAIVYIGRRNKIAKGELDSLRKRNAEFSNLSIFTYDTLFENLQKVEELIAHE